jgi:hypothetical protein
MLAFSVPDEGYSKNASCALDFVEGGIAGCGVSFQYHPLLWWAGLRKVREKYHIYIYQ